MKIACLQFNPIQENTYIVWDDTKACIVIDAGNSNPREDAALDNFIAEHGLKPVMAVNTHGHFDHTLGVEHLKQRYGIPFALSSKDQFLLDNAATSGSVFGVKIGQMPAAEIDLDTLFRESIGRTDLPGGDYSWIMRSILDSLVPLGEEVHVYPGHGPESTIGHEMLYNPFIVEVLNEEVNYKE